MRRKNSDKSPASLAVKRVALAFKTEGHKIERHVDGFTLLRPLFSTRVTVAPASPESADRIDHVIRIETKLPPLDHQGDEFLATLNSLTLFSACARRDDGTISAMSSMPVPRGETVIDEYLLSMVIAFQTPAFTAAIRFGMEGPNKDDVLAGGELPGPWKVTEFEEALKALDLDAEINGHTMGMRFAWTDAAGASVPPAVGGMQFGRHGLFGYGLRFMFAPPVQYDRASMAEVCRQLNCAEFDDDLAAPLLGAWAIAPNEQISFFGFIPNMLHRPDIATTVAAWLTRRSAWSRYFLAH